MVEHCLLARAFNCSGELFCIFSLSSLLIEYLSVSLVQGHNTYVYLPPLEKSMAIFPGHQAWRMTAEVICAATGQCF
jgi:hypothetical protein